jgi:aspartate 1-decarboxylase
LKRTMMSGKIHRATVTDANVDYEGSISVDSDLRKAAGMLPYEQVHVVDIDNGARLVTYLIDAEPGSGAVVLNGAAARLVHKGDRVIIIAYAEMEDAQAAGHVPRIVLVDEANRPVKDRVRLHGDPVAN